MSSNQAAWLHNPNTPLEVSEAPMPTAGPGEIVVCNAAVAINPLDCHMQDSGVFIQQWPAVFGCDVAGTVHEVGPDVHGRFKKGDRVIGHTINLVSGRPQDGAFALYTTIPVDKAAILPSEIAFTDGVVIPLALEAAVCALSLKEPGIAMPGVATPALGLPYPSLDLDEAQGLHSDPLNKTVIIYGGSSSVGLMTTQLATAAGITVLSICSAHNAEMSKKSGAVEVFNYHDPSFMEQIVAATHEPRFKNHEVIGIIDAVSTPETYTNDLTLLAKLSDKAGDGTAPKHLACVHPPPSAPSTIPDHIKTGMIFAINPIATPVWTDYVTPALRAGKLKCLPPPYVAEKGLAGIQKALDRYREGGEGISGRKVIVEL